MTPILLYFFITLLPVAATELDEVLHKSSVVAARAQGGVVLHEHRPGVWKAGAGKACVRALGHRHRHALRPSGFEREVPLHTLLTYCMSIGPLSGAQGRGRRAGVRASSGIDEVAVAVAVAAAVAAAAAAAAVVVVARW